MKPLYKQPAWSCYGRSMFVSNVDGTDFAEALNCLDPAETLLETTEKR